jgi:hypothetical protein
MCIYYTIYETTNIVNGFVYIGQHITPNPNDSYLGSGLKLKNAIKKYGRQSFKKKVLFVFNSYEEMNKKEAELVTESFIKNNNTYNIVTGGSAGIGLNNKGKAPWNKGKTGVQTYYPETYQKTSLSLRKPKTGAHCKNISLGKKGKKQKIVICPYCNISGGISNLTRYHFDNCKSLISEM